MGFGTTMALYSYKNKNMTINGWLSINKPKFNIMDGIKLAQRTIAMLDSMIESGECHTTRSNEMKDNALNELEKLHIQHNDINNEENIYNELVDASERMLKTLVEENPCIRVFPPIEQKTYNSILFPIKDLESNNYFKIGVSIV